MVKSAGELLEDRLIGVCSQLNTVHAELVDVAIELLDSGAWKDYWGYRSPNMWLRIKAGVSQTHARQILQVAEAASTHPTILSYFRKSRLTLDQTAAAVACASRRERPIGR